MFGNYVTSSMLGTNVIFLLGCGNSFRVSCCLARGLVAFFRDFSLTLLGQRGRILRLVDCGSASLAATALTMIVHYLWRGLASLNAQLFRWVRVEIFARSREHRNNRLVVAICVVTAARAYELTLSKVVGLCRGADIVSRANGIVEVARQAIHSSFNITQKPHILFGHQAALLRLGIFSHQPTLTMSV